MLSDITSVRDTDEDHNTNIYLDYYNTLVRAIIGIDFVLGITSKLNRRLTARNRRFWVVAIVLNNGNRSEPMALGGQLAVEF